MVSIKQRWYCQNLSLIVAAQRHRFGENFWRGRGVGRVPFITTAERHAALAPRTERQMDAHQECAWCQSIISFRLTQAEDHSHRTGGGDIRAKRRVRAREKERDAMAEMDGCGRRIRGKTRDPL